MTEDYPQAKSDLSNLHLQIQKGFGFCCQCGIVRPDEDELCPECGATAAGPELNSLADDIKTAIDQISELEEKLEAAKRIIRNDYTPWDSAGGPNECAHGYAGGVPCPYCDRAIACP